MEFLLGKEMSEILADEFSTPLRAHVSVRAGVRPLNETEVLTATTDQIVKEVREVAELFRDTFGI